MSDLVCHLDFESRSDVDLRKAGVYRYMQSVNTIPWGFCYRVGNVGAMKEWRPGWPDPTDLLEHMAAGGRVACHNAAFERTMWNWIVLTRYCPHWPPMVIEQQDCTMSRAAAVALPQSLDKLGHALKTNMTKDMEGNRLMMKLAKPRRVNEDGSITWWDDPADVNRTMIYCAGDVEVETEADTLLPPLSDKERRVWEFDQRINDRGVMIDLPFVQRAAELVAYTKKQNDKVMRDLTNRDVSKCSKDAEIIKWLNGRGIECTSIAKGEVEDVIFAASAAFDQTAHDVIKLRQANWKTSTAKYKSALDCVNSDHRIRGLLNYHGASTGRWAGRLTQPQNYPRVDPDDKFLQGKIEYLHWLAANCETIREMYHGIADLYGPLEVMELLSKALRSTFVAAPGHKYVGGDFSNIEGRVNSWQAGEAWKLDAFKAYDEGTGPDLYKLAYATSFGVEVESVGKGQKRQIGKVQELALGYQGGVGAFLTMGANYGLDPFTLALPVKQATDPYQWEGVRVRYHAPGTKRMDLFEDQWCALQVLVDNWRAANPAVVQSWWNLQDAAIEAVAAPGYLVHPAHTQKIGYYSDGRALWCLLPSGRMLCYSSPWVEQEEVEYYHAESGETRTRLKRSVKFWGTNSKTRQWQVQNLYGGLQCENIVQAIARDIMVDAMFRVEAAGYPIVLTVHDEILSEVDDSLRWNETEFAQVMAQLDDCYEGLPVSVGAWEDKRYVK